MKKTTVILSSLVMLLLAACSSGGFKKTRSGLLYNIKSGGNGPVAKKGDVIKFHIVQKVHDSLLNSSYGKMPMYAMIDSVGSVYDPREIFPLLRKGDSATVVIMADTLFKRGINLPPFIRHKDKLTMSFKVLDVFTSDSLARADQSAEMAKEQQRQMGEAAKQQEEGEKLKGPKVKEIEDYLASKKIVAQKTPNGTFVVVKEAGSGTQADSGKTLQVRYTGKLFPSEKVFESNMEAGKQPFQLVLGTHQVIRGWDEGLKYFKKGGKGTLYIPFFEAYGTQPGPGGKPFENLIFDVEVVDVQNTPAPSAQQQQPMPPGQ